MKTVYVAIVNDQGGDHNVFGPFRELNDAIHFCQTTKWGPSYIPDETGQVPFGVGPLIAPSDTSVTHG